MHHCPQTEGQSVLEHGFSVNQYFRDIIGPSLFPWKLPDYFDFYRELLVATLYPLDVVDRYTTYHDCGKPYCIVSDELGNHFPNHAKISQETYQALTGDATVSNLIGWDMVLHTCTAKELEEYLNIWTPQDAATLLLVAFSELHSNASMFGGIESLSFKIKYKRLKKRGKQLCKHLYGEIK
jgi:hypothetical protein